MVQVIPWLQAGKQGEVRKITLTANSLEILQLCLFLQCESPPFYFTFDICTSRAVSHVLWNTLQARNTYLGVHKSYVSKSIRMSCILTCTAFDIESCLCNLCFFIFLLFCFFSAYFLQLLLSAGFIPFSLLTFISHLLEVHHHFFLLSFHCSFSFSKR